MNTHKLKRTTSVTMIPLIGAALLLTGCNHGDAIIFASNKQIGVKVGMDTKEVPEVSIGYNGQDFAFVPLYKKGYKPDTVSETKFNKDAKYEAWTDGTNRTDAYSVYGSFTGDSKGDATGANLGLGHFFATGLAAQLLGEDSGKAAVGLAKAQAEADAKVKQAELDAQSQVKAADAKAQDQVRAKVQLAEQDIWVTRLVAEVKSQNAADGAPDLTRRRSLVRDALGMDDERTKALLSDDLLRSDAQLRNLASEPKYHGALKSYYRNK